jgi:hypothetical protein
MNDQMPSTAEVEAPLEPVSYPRIVKEACNVGSES